MRNFNESLENLLKDCETLLKPEAVVSNKWFALNDSRQEVRQVNNKRESLVRSYVHASSKISKLESYEKCQKAFDEDVIFNNASRLAGYWGSFRSVFQDIILASGCVRKNKVLFDINCAIDRASKKREELSASTIHINCNSRLLGVKLKSKVIDLPNGLSLYRLNKRELNARQPFIEPYSSSFQESQLAFQPTELRMSLEVPVNRTKDQAFFLADNEGHKIARNTFKNFLDAILLLKDGHIELGPPHFDGGPIEAPTTRGIYQNFMPNLDVTIKKQDAQNIIKAYELVSGESAGSDKVISRALHRFLLGRKRRDLVDKLIDFVISWESLLLTQNGSPATSELIYRFSINGSSLIATITKTKDRKKYFKMMKSIYSLRCVIVHGGTDEKINKNIKSGEFNNMDDVCGFLEKHFKITVWWLLGLAPQNRPYMKKDGWEELLWPKSITN